MLKLLPEVPQGQEAEDQARQLCPAGSPTEGQEAGEPQLCPPYVPQKTPQITSIFSEPYKRHTKGDQKTVQEMDR